MNWLAKTLASEFVWGIVIGILLSALSAWIGLRLNRTHLQKNVRRFCLDLASNVSELVDGLNDTRQKHRFIDSEFLDLIDVEIQIYGRNREHLIAIDDDKLRRDIRDYFTRVAGNVARIRIHLKHFQENYLREHPSTYPDPARAHEMQQVANGALAAAHTACDNLRDLIIAKSGVLESRLRE
ncbi:hypothetical protein [Hyphomonas sp.]|uniref:hypothetical protein n=1 Tax=Hyphomonas sp. TaxID=87 RepID=UPI003D2AB3E1